jgi:hypothetical protein
VHVKCTKYSEDATRVLALLFAFPLVTLDSEDVVHLDVDDVHTANTDPNGTSAGYSRPLSWDSLRCAVVLEEASVIVRQAHALCHEYSEAACRNHTEA